MSARATQGGFRIGRAIALVVAPPLLLALAILAEIAWYGTRSAPGPADAAIVLGAAVYGSVPSPVFRERIRHAVDLHRAGTVKRVVMTGGRAEGDRLAEAEAARDWSVAEGLPAEAILLEARSRTTEENLALSLPLLREAGLRRVLLVSDPLHMRRAMALAQKLGIEAEPSPTPTSRYTGWGSWTRFLLREGYFLTRCRLAFRC